ncbi:MAG: 2-phospho-L-lactate transferase [Promethearchaeota archaeon]|nr:MAG: 2-phospho-L-lactate transferase [Candidatus Lokiarchaeota archaeon]
MVDYITENEYLILAGGVGAAKFIDGLSRITNPEQLKIIVNTGDDITLFGLLICPDLDIITYTLANIVDREKGWGIAEETFSCLSYLKKFYQFDWFNAGDKDLATHIYRTDLYNKGFSKKEITKKICKKLGVHSEIIPMCNETVETYIHTPERMMHFEEFYIKYQSKPDILNVDLRGIEQSKLIQPIKKYMKTAERIIICPSNPIVSINTILSVENMKDLLQKEKQKIIAISPIIEGKTVKGPADKLLRSVNLEASSYGVAKFYKNIAGHIIIDERDCYLKEKIESLGIKVYCFDTLMKNIEKKKKLAQFTLEIKI